MHTTALPPLDSAFLSRAWTRAQRADGASPLGRTVAIIQRENLTNEQMKAACCATFLKELYKDADPTALDKRAAEMVDRFDCQLHMKSIDKMKTGTYSSHSPPGSLPEPIRLPPRFKLPPSKEQSPHPFFILSALAFVTLIALSRLLPRKSTV